MLMKKLGLDEKNKNYHFGNTNLFPAKHENRDPAVL